MATDWTAVRLEYVHGTDTMRELAEKRGIKAAGLMRRAANEGWEADRKQESAKVSRVASVSIGESRADQLAKFNDDDLRMARAVRARAAQMMAEAHTPSQLNAVASVMEKAQKVGRLALGASTENQAVTTKGLPSSIDEFV